ncbi:MULTISPECIES: acyltransferase family protein [unclassified Colwellia]|uniref:acyltransferase family protein n=1 Tax=unclassified Colwellia TaxID=196834 RepID=UPI0015F37DB7|nr:MULTISPECIES: acyltransferase family protein [unclassified Colwellia]MBA6256284.1 acyltransferase family protein [Colwellia sp. MB3u-28]MBA6260168.1 acyltransferase family protein [Colwellia sp. MB3u-41]
MIINRDVNNSDKLFINHLRGLLILRVVLAHLGLSWFFLPYSSYVNAFFPSLFMISGIVTYYSFLRAKNSVHFISNRLIRLYTPYLIIVLLAFILIFLLHPTLNVNIFNFFDVLTMNMSIENEPYPISQVWFLRTLVFITLLTLPIFILSSRSAHWLLLPVLVSIILSIGHTNSNIGSMFLIKFKGINEINLYQPLASMGYYAWGAWLYATNKFSNNKFQAIIIVICSINILIIYLNTDLDINLANHAYYQDIYYMTVAFLAISLLLILRPILQYAFSIQVISRFLLFSNYHAFTIFLVHTFFIQISETYFGWISIADDPKIIIYKISFVILASCLVSIPLSKISKQLTNKLIKLNNKRLLLSK